MAPTAQANGVVDVSLGKPADLPEAVVKRGANEAQWRTLCNNLYPGADPQSVLMVLDYCAARNLDPLKKPCHIVQMDVKDARSNTWTKRDVVMPGIYEYRTTAQRTGVYLGHTKPAYGPPMKVAGIEAPEWCEMTMFRWNPTAARIVEFPVMVFFSEVVATKQSGDANARWTKAPRQMLVKCTEAAGLREAFPEEFGGEATADEMDGQRVIEIERPEPPKPAQRVSQQPAAPATTPAATDGAAGPQQDQARTMEMPSAAAGPVGGSAAPSSAAPAANVGLIAHVHDKGNGAAIVELNTGFTASTRDAAMQESAARLRDAKTLVELETTPSSDQAKYAPKLTGILPLQDAEAAQ